MHPTEPSALPSPGRAQPHYHPRDIFHCSITCKRLQSFSVIICHGNGGRGCSALASPQRPWELLLLERAEMDLGTSESPRLCPGAAATQPSCFSSPPAPQNPAKALPTSIASPPTPVQGHQLEPHSRPQPFPSRRQQQDSSSPSSSPPVGAASRRKLLL